MQIAGKSIAYARASAAFVKLVRDTSKLDEVFTILDSLQDHGKADESVRIFTEDPALAPAFRARRSLYPIDLGALARLPLGTLGRTYADQMRARGLSPDDIQLQPDDGTDRSYAFRHLRETHDVWHTATGFATDVAGELGLLAFYLAQFRSQLSLVLIAIGVLNTAFFALEDTDARFTQIARGWAMGRAARPLFGFDWAAHWATPLSEVREALGLVAPTSTQHAA